MSGFDGTWTYSAAYRDGYADGHSAKVATLDERIDELRAERDALQQRLDHRIATRPKVSRRDLNTRNKELRAELAELRGERDEATALLREWFEPYADDLRSGRIQGTDFLRRVAALLRATSPQGTTPEEGTD